MRAYQCLLDEKVDIEVYIGDTAFWSRIHYKVN